MIMEERDVYGVTTGSRAGSGTGSDETGSDESGSREDGSGTRSDDDVDQIDESSIDDLTTTLPGILRLQCGVPSQFLGNDFSGDRHVPCHDSGAAVGRLLGIDRRERPRSKKRVTFEPDGDLEKVLEISPREDYYPLLEELHPCDPDKLIQRHGIQLYGDVYNSSFMHTTGVIHKRNSQTNSTRMTGPLGYGMTTTPSVGPPLTQTVNRTQPAIADRRLTHDSGRLAQDNRRLALSNQRANGRFHGTVQRNRIHSAPVTKSSPMASRADTRGADSSVESPMEQRLSRNGAGRGMYSRSRSATYREKTPLTHAHTGGIIYSRPFHNKQDLISPHLNLNRSRGPQLKVNGTSTSFNSRTPMHQSPYRQGAANPINRTLRPETGMPSALSVSGARIDAHSTADRQPILVESVSPRKVHAWQSADNATRTNSLMVSEPCIAQMWNSPRTTIDALYHSKCS